MTVPFVPPPNPNAIRSTEQRNLGQPGFQGAFSQPGVENTYGDMRDILSQSGGGMGMLDWIPILSQLRGMFQAGQQAQQGHPMMGAAMGALSLIPGGGGKAKAAEEITVDALASFRKKLGLLTEADFPSMSDAAILDYIDHAASMSRNIDRQVLGEETWKTYNKAYRVAENAHLLHSPAEQKAAEDVLSAIEDGMTPAQRLLFYGDKKNPAYADENDAANFLRLRRSSAPRQLPDPTKGLAP